MRTVYKYPLDLDDSVTIDTPEDFQPIHAGFQNGVPCVWAVVDPDSPTVKRTFHIRGTGHPLDFPYLSAGFVGTCLSPLSPFVWHIWMET